MSGKRRISIDEVVTVEVKSVATFGAFVVLENGQEGMIHISEISDGFVKDINERVKVGDKLRVLVTGFNKRGKAELSYKRIKPENKDVVKDEKVSPFIHQGIEQDEFESKLIEYLK